MLLDDNHTMQIQWDGSLIEKGFKDIETRFKNLDNLTAKTQRKVKVESSHDVDKAIIADKQRALKEQQKLGRELAAEKTREARREIAHEQALAMHKRQSAVAEANALRQEATLLKENRRINEARKKIDSQMTGLKGSNSPQAKAQMAALEKHIKHLKVAQDFLNSSVKKGDSQFLKYQATLQSVTDKTTHLNKTTTAITRNFNAQKFAADGLGSSLKNMARSWVSVFAVIGGVGFLKRTAQDMENIGVAALLASGNAKQSAKDLEFVGELTERLGLRYKDTAKAFATFSVGAISGGVSPKEAKEVFVQISEGLASAGTNAESAKLAFLGFRQMISGTVVQSQELNQIIDQVPAFSGAAVQALDAMGIRSADVFDKTTKSFKDTIKTAGVDAKQFTKIVSKILSDQGISSGALAEYVQSISAEESRLVNALDKTVEGMSEAGLKDLFKSVFGGLTNILQAVQPALIALSTTFGLLATAISKPFEWIDKLGMALGLNEGEGLQMAIRGVITLLLMKLVPSMIAATKTMYGLVAGSINSAKGFFGMGTAATVAGKQVKGLTLAVNAFKRAFWPLLVVELGLGLFSSVTSNQFSDMTEAAKTFREEQAALNKELETAQGFYKLGLVIWENVAGMWDRIVGSIQRAIGYAVEFSKLSFTDAATTALKDTVVTVASMVDTVNNSFGGNSDFRGSARDIVGESAIDKALNPEALRGQQAANTLTAGATVTNHYTINGDPEIIQASIKEGMDRYVPEYLQTVYSGGG